MRIGSEYFFYDLNIKKRLPFVSGPELLICLIAKHHVLYKIGCLQEDSQINREMLNKLMQQKEKLEELEKKILEEGDTCRRKQLIVDNQNILLPLLGFSLSIYSHPDQPRLDSAWQDSMTMLNKEYYQRRDFWVNQYFEHARMATGIVEKLL